LEWARIANPRYRVFEQHLEASKAEAFAGKTPSKSHGKAGEETLFAQVSVLQNRKFTPNSSF